MPNFITPKAILDRFTGFPVQLTLEDPQTQQPISMSYENLHLLATIDLQSIDLESQIITNMYIEMARMERAAEWECRRAEGRYRRWKAQMAEELRTDPDRPEKKTASGKKAAKQGPTSAEIEEYYRSHADYEEYSNAPARWETVAGLFKDLKWAFKMKSEHLLSMAQYVGGFEGTTRNEQAVGERLEDYQSLAAEAARITAASGAKEDADRALKGAAGDGEDGLSGKDPKTAKKPRAL